MPRKAALFSLFSFALLITNLASSGTPHLVLDINSVSTPKSSLPLAVGSLGNNAALFRIDLSTLGVTRSGLVKSDGTSANTTTLKTFAGNGPLQRAMTLGTRAFFDAEEGGHQLWVTDGTADGTRQVTTFSPAPTNAVRPIAAFGTDILLARPITARDFELFRSDGTTAGTTSLGPITAYGGSSTLELAVVGNKIYFIASTQDTQQTELWVSDGTSSGTHKVSGVNALDSYVTLSGLAPLNGGVVFFSYTSAYGTELTRVDASEAVSVIDLIPGPVSGTTSGNQTKPAVMNGYAYFSATDGNTGQELWRTDGTLSGTTMVKDIGPGTAGGASTVSPDVVRVGDRLIFLADDRRGLNPQLWSTDGTAAGTVVIATDVSLQQDALRFPAETTSVKYKYIRAYGIGGASTTIITDGTPSGTAFTPLTVDGNPASLLEAAGDATKEYVEIVNYNPTTGAPKYGVYQFAPPSQFTLLYSSTDTTGMNAFVHVNGKLLFDGLDAAAGRELLTTDETGTRLAVDLRPGATTDSSTPAWFTDWNGKAVFSAFDGVHGTELWTSDGTAAGTQLLVDINKGPDSSAPVLLTVWNGAFYFFAFDGTATRLMRMTAPGATPEVLATLYPPLRLISSGPEQVRCSVPNAVPLGNKLLFTAQTLEAGTELWSTDGTAAGTTMVANLNTNTLFNGQEMGSQPCSLTAFQNRVYFTAFTDPLPAPGTLWSSDGTTAGTTRFGDFLNSGGYVAYKNELYFRAITTATVNTLGSQTWKTDGTTAGTRTVVAATSATDKFDANPAGVTNGQLILYTLTTPSTSTTPASYALWASDGTTSPAVQLGSSTLRGGLLVTSNRILFTNNPQGDEEPWVSDGTVAGTHRLADLDSAGSSRPFRYLDFRGVGVIATDDSTGPHLWRTDGTESGTTQIGTLPRQGGPLTSPGLNTYGVAGQTLFFNAADNTLGDELYAVTNDPPAAVADSANAANGAAVSVNVLSNDADPDGSLDPSSTRIVQAPAHGTAAVGTNGTITYTPTAGYSGSDTFTYTVADNQGNTSNAATVTLTVTAAPPSSGGGTGSDGGGKKGGGGPLGWFDVLALAALAAWRFVRTSTRNRAAWKNLSPAVNNL